MKTDTIKKVLCGVAMGLLHTAMNAQITFQRIYDATIHESGKDVLQTSDGGYIIAASTETSIVNDLDIMIVRTNNLGDTLWRKSYGGNLPELPNGILKAADGNYFVVGFTQSSGPGDYDHYLLKINAVTGDSIFSRVYGGYGNEESKEIISTSDGNYVIVGASNSIDLSDNQGQLIKIDINGNVIWSKYYGTPLYESLRSVKQCSDGGFIIAGKRIDPAGMASIYLVRTNAIGDTLWTKLQGSTSSMEGKSILVNSDGSYTLSADDSSAVADSDVHIMRFDSGGNLSWNKKYGGTEKDICKMIQPTSDGGYIVAALSRSFGWIDPDYWLLKLDSGGDTLWTRHYGGTDHEHCYAVRQTSDGGYVAVGHTRSHSPTRIEEIMLIKMNANGEMGPLGLDENTLAGTFNVYPNPSMGNVNILLDKGVNGEVSVRNSLGQMIYTEKIGKDGLSTLDLKGNQPGVYFISLLTNDSMLTRKLVLN